MNDALKIVKTQNISLQIIYAAGLHKDMHGIVTSAAPDKYIILLNADDTDRQKTESFLHECLHIFHGDLEREDTAVNQIEAERHIELESILSGL